MLAGCEKGPSGRVLEVRMEDMNEKLKLIEKRTESAMLMAETGSQDLKQRIEAVELKGTEVVTQTSSLVEANEARFQRIEQTLTNVMRIKEESEAVAYLDPTSEGHRTLKTDHGTFLVRMEKIQRNPAGGGFTIDLNIGNPTGLELQEYRLKGDFGQPAPQLQPGEAYGDYSVRLDEWQKTMIPFEETIVVPVLPNAWSRISLPLNAPSEESLKLIRVAMVVQRARLSNQEGAGDYSVVNADSDGAGLVKTEYGPLLMTVTGMVPEGGSTRVQVSVGNPFGFIINEGILSGQFGPTAPRKMESESTGLYQQRLLLWSQEMEEFKTRFTGTISPLSWSQASFVLPTTDQSRIKYLRLKLEVSNLTLPKSTAP